MLEQAVHLVLSMLDLFWGEVSKRYQAMEARSPPAEGSVVHGPDVPAGTENLSPQLVSAPLDIVSPAVMSLLWEGGPPPLGWTSLNVTPLQRSL